ncbi:MAG: DHHA1 domain-containing protein, partial [Fibrobacteraceae bacterium]
MGTEGWTVFSEGSTRFVGYEFSSCGTKVLRYREDKGILSIVLESTPFYAEMGGEVGEKGVLVSDGLEISVFDTIKVNDTVIHRGKVVVGTVEEASMGGLFFATVNDELRKDTRRNHSATHLLQAALREVLGTHVAQQGSHVAPEGLRFDFSHFSGMTAEQIAQVEDLVNAQVMATLPITTKVMKLEDAQATGAMALFGEKYENDVRVVSMGDFSKELCGGLHALNTGEIGMVKILAETSVSAGVRRIEAVTGRGALKLLRDSTAILSGLRDRLRCKDESLLERIDNSFENLKTLEKTLAGVKLELATLAATDILKEAVNVNGVSLYIKEMTVAEDKFKDLLDGVQAKLPKGSAVVLGNKTHDSGSIAVIVEKSVQDKGLKAGELVKLLAEIAGGKGGGRPDRAQAGTREPAKISAALAAAIGFIQEKISK